MYIIRENVNGKIFACDNEKRLAEYKENNKKQKDVDLTFYEVVENATSKNLTLKKDAS